MLVVGVAVAVAAASMFACYFNMIELVWFSFICFYFNQNDENTQSGIYLSISIYKTLNEGWFIIRLFIR